MGASDGTASAHGGDLPNSLPRLEELPVGRCHPSEGEATDSLCPASSGKAEDFGSDGGTCPAVNPEMGRISGSPEDLDPSKTSSWPMDHDGLTPTHIENEQASSHIPVEEKVGEAQMDGAGVGSGSAAVFEQESAVGDLPQSSTKKTTNTETEEEEGVGRHIESQIEAPDSLTSEPAADHVEAESAVLVKDGPTSSPQQTAYPRSVNMGSEIDERLLIDIALLSPPDDIRSYLNTCFVPQLRQIRRQQQQERGRHGRTPQLLHLQEDAEGEEAGDSGNIVKSEGHPTEHQNCSKPPLHPVNSLPVQCRRVKLYEVDSDTGNWIDKGTGHFYVEDSIQGVLPEVESPQGSRLVVRDEDGVSVFVNSVISRNRVYQHQKESIITWQEGPQGDFYRALSFQHPHGCFACWTYIHLIAPDQCAGVMQDDELDEEDADLVRDSLDGLGDATGGSNGGVFGGGSIEESLGSSDMIGVLEEPSLATLPTLMRRMEIDLQHPQMGGHLLQDIAGRVWLRSFFALMRRLVDEGQVEALKQMAFIIRKMLVAWCGQLDTLEIFLSDEFWLDVLQCLEYDQDLLNQGLELRHREFFESMQTREVLQSSNTAFVRLLHMHYRITYLKDVALTRYVDEGSIAQLQHVLSSNGHDIVRLLTVTSPTASPCPSPSGRGDTQTLSPPSCASAESSTPVGGVATETPLQILQRRIGKDYYCLLFVREFFALLQRLTTGPAGMCNPCGLGEGAGLHIGQQSVYALFLQIKSSELLLQLKGYLAGTDEALAMWNEVVVPMNRKAEKHHTALIQKLLSAPPGQHRPNPLDFDSFSYPHPLTVSVEILHTFAEIQPQIFRQILFMEAPQDTHFKRDELLKLPPESAQSQQLLMLLCRVLGKADNDSVQVVVKDIFLKVVCGINMELPERDEMNALFYDRGIMDALLELLFTDLSEVPRERVDTMRHAKQMVLEIFSHCVTAHRHRFKVRILRDHVPLRTLLTALRPKFDKFLSLYAVKFIKACVGLKDSYVDKHLIRFKIFRPIIWMLKEDYLAPQSTTRRLGGSLLSCAVLDLLGTLLPPSYHTPGTFGTQNTSLVEFLFEDKFTEEWIQQIENTIERSRKGPCTVLRELRMFYCRVTVCARRGPRYSESSSLGGPSADGDASPSPRRLSSMGRLIRPDPNKGSDSDDDDSWYFGRKDDDDESPTSNQPTSDDVDEAAAPCVSRLSLVEGYDEDEDSADGRAGVDSGTDLWVGDSDNGDKKSPRRRRPSTSLHSSDSSSDSDEEAGRLGESLGSLGFLPRRTGNSSLQNAMERQQLVFTSDGKSPQGSLLSVFPDKAIRVGASELPQKGSMLSSPRSGKKIAVRISSRPSACSGVGPSGTSSSSSLDTKGHDDVSLPSTAGAVVAGEPTDTQNRVERIDTSGDSASKTIVDKEVGERLDQRCTNEKPISSDNEEVGAANDALAGAKLLAEVLNRSGTGSVSLGSPAVETCSSGDIEKLHNATESASRYSHLDLIRDLLEDDAEGCTVEGGQGSSVESHGMCDNASPDGGGSIPNLPTADGGDSKRRKML